MNIRQANGLGRVHVAKPGIKETYCGRSVNEEDWLTTFREANCTSCARAGGRPNRRGRGEVPSQEQSFSTSVHQGA